MLLGDGMTQSSEGTMLRCACVGFSCAEKGKWLGGGGFWVWVVVRRGPKPCVGGLRGLTGGGIEEVVVGG